MSNPILIELTRGALVESTHRGILAVAKPNGELVVSVGEVLRPVFPRSAIKSLQALPLIESGAADRYGFGAAELAIACASHSGTERHTRTAAGMLAKAGLSPEALGCGPQTPGHEESAHKLVKSGAAPGQLHNNCSGKHAGMLATATHLGEPPARYWMPDHPIQVRVAKVIEAVSGLSLGPEIRGTDGCSLPNWGIPVATLATTFARLASGETLAPARRAAIGRLMAACWAEPEMVSGPGRLDAFLLGHLEGRLFTKTGAEGVYCAALPGRGLGIALKIEDGTPRAAQAAMAFIARHLFPDLPAPPQLAPLRNWRGTEVGEVRIGAGLAGALDRLPA